MRYTLLAILLASSACFASGGIHWEPCKQHAKEQNKTSGKHSMHGGATMLALSGAEDKNISASYLLPDLSTANAELKEGMIIPKINMGGYYALTALSVDVNGSDFAIRYLSANGKPTKISPSKLTNKQKNILEILPNPLPREHDRYTASKEYGFVVSYNGKPLEGADVMFTIGDDKFTIKSADKGILKVALPNNFSDVTPEKRESKEFVLSVSKEDGGKTYTASLSAPYYPNANDWWQSQYLGFGGMALGFLGGLALYMRARKDNK